jgi:hypothetical protein
MGWSISGLQIEFQHACVLMLAASPFAADEGYAKQLASCCRRMTCVHTCVKLRVVPCWRLASGWSTARHVSPRSWHLPRHNNVLFKVVDADQISSRSRKERTVYVSYRYSAALLNAFSEFFSLACAFSSECVVCRLQRLPSRSEYFNTS